MTRSFKDLAGQTMRRHGFGRQVEAGMLVKRINDLLSETPALSGQVYAISFKFGILLIGLMHPALRPLVEKETANWQPEIDKLLGESVEYRYKIISQPPRAIIET